MILLFISTMRGFPWGGSEELWVRTAAIAISRGHRVFVSVEKWPVMNIKIQELERAGATIVSHTSGRKNLSQRLRSKITTFNNTLLPASFRRLLKLKPDRIIISQGSAFDLVHLPEYRKVIETLKAPYFLIIQHNIEIGWRLDKSQRETAQTIFEGAKGLFFVAQRNLDTAQRQLALEFQNACVIQNPVNLSKWALQEWPEQSTLKLACVARYDVTYKGQDILLEVLHNSIWKQRNFMLFLYGAGPDEEYLEELINHYNLKNQVKLQGHFDNICSLWMQHHVLILPSISEGTPLALFEAQICGRPAIGTDVGDIANVIKEGVTGFIASAPTTFALAEALETMWQNRNKLEEMGRAAHQHAISILDPSPELTLLEKLIT